MSNSGRIRADQVSGRISRGAFLKSGGAGLAGAMLLGTVGCGGNQQTQGGGKPIKGGTLNATFDQDPPTLDPALAYDFVSWPLIHAMFVTLITYDKSGQGFVPWAATSVPEPQDGGKKYVFTLHEGMKFTNGEPVDAAAFEYQVERILDPRTKSPLSGFYTNIVGAEDFQKNPKGSLKGVKVLSPTKIEFDLEKPDQTFLQTLCLPSLSAVPKKAVRKYGQDFSTNAVGSGQFKLRQWKHGSKLVMVKNKGYFDKTTAAKLDEVDFDIGIDPHTALQRVEQGSADISSIPSTDFNAVKNDPKWKKYVRHGTLNVLEYFYVNTQKKPYTDPKVRKAMGYALDKKRLVQVINGRAKVADQILPPNMPGHDKSINGTAHDPKKAKQLLKEAGYSKGFEMTFWNADDPDGNKIAQVIQQDLSEIGIKARIRTVSFSEYLSQTKSGKTDAGLANWYQDFPDPSDFLDILFNSNQIPANNYARYSNPEIDKELKEAQYMLNHDKRLGLYQKIQKRILSENPIVPLYYPVEYDFVSPKVGGFKVHPVWTGAVYANWYLTK